MRSYDESRCGQGWPQAASIPVVYSLPLYFSCTGQIGHDAAHCPFMTLPAYTRIREGEVHPLGNGPKPCRPGLGVRKGSPTFDSQEMPSLDAKHRPVHDEGTSVHNNRDGMDEK
jgi:hypothetical protein